MDDHASADLCVGIDRDIGIDDAVLSDGHILADESIRVDHCTLADPGTFRDGRPGVQRRLRGYRERIVCSEGIRSIQQGFSYT